MRKRLLTLGASVVLLLADGTGLNADGFVANVKSFKAPSTLDLRSERNR